MEKQVILVYKGTKVRIALGFLIRQWKLDVKDTMFSYLRENYSWLQIPYTVKWKQGEEIFPHTSPLIFTFHTSCWSGNKMREYIKKEHSISRKQGNNCRKRWRECRMVVMGDLRMQLSAGLESSLNGWRRSEDRRRCDAKKMKWTHVFEHIERTFTLLGKRLGSNWW